jgi:hypothetical protein
MEILMRNTSFFQDNKEIWPTERLGLRIFSNITMVSFIGGGHENHGGLLS